MVNCSCGYEPILDVRLMFNGRQRCYVIRCPHCERKTGLYMTREGAETEWEAMQDG